MSQSCLGEGQGWFTIFSWFLYHGNVLPDKILQVLVFKLCSLRILSVATQWFKAECVLIELTEELSCSFHAQSKKLLTFAGKTVFLSFGVSVSFWHLDNFTNIRQILYSKDKIIAKAIPVQSFLTVLAKPNRNCILVLNAKVLLVIIIH